jgi:hypothetical protein
MNGRIRLVIAVAAALLAGGQAALPSAGASTTVTVGPVTSGPGASNSYPFGLSPVGEWGEYAGFIYKNVPGFQLKSGDTVAFDTAGENEVDIGLEVGMAATTVNGGDVPAQAFTTVVQNSQLAASPRGDTTVGNYELRWTAQAPFSFPGGGLAIRFNNPSPAFAADMTPTAMTPANITSADASGFFVERFHGDPDGTAPWAATDPENMAPFQLVIADLPQPAPAPKKKKCKKKKKKGKTAAKKKCKKKKKKR